MKPSKRTLLIACAGVILALTFAFPVQLPSQTAAEKPAGGSGGSAEQYNIQVDQVDRGNLDLAYSFQFAIYENLVNELKKTGRFQQVFREGNRAAREAPNLLVLKTTVEKYNPGSETQRAVTTVSGATKLTVRTELLTKDGEVVLERTVNGNVRFFGSNLRATQNLARNIAKAIQQSSLAGSEQPSATLPAEF